MNEAMDVQGSNARTTGEGSLEVFCVDEEVPTTPSLRVVEMQNESFVVQHGGKTWQVICSEELEPIPGKTYFPVLAAALPVTKSFETARIVSVSIPCYSEEAETLQRLSFPSKVYLLSWMGPSKSLIQWRIISMK